MLNRKASFLARLFTLAFLKFCRGIKFFQTPTKITIINSSGKNFNVYHHPKFGKRIVNNVRKSSKVEDMIQVPQTIPYSINMIIDFIDGFHKL